MIVGAGMEATSCGCVMLRGVCFCSTASADTTASTVQRVQITDGTTPTNGILIGRKKVGLITNMTVGKVSDMKLEDMRKLWDDLNQSISRPEDFFGGPHMKMWSKMTEQERKDTISWWENSHAE